jgi:hypothetical protein
VNGGRFTLSFRDLTEKLIKVVTSIIEVILYEPEKYDVAKFGDLTPFYRALLFA